MARVDYAPEILGGECIRKVKDGVRAFAQRQKPMLLIGETGTGKELLARYATRVARPEAMEQGRFLTVNMAGHKAEQFRGLYFGHRKGAFTGAHGRQEGLFRENDGGGVLLDELNRTDPDLLAALLRFLDSGEVEPLGERPVSVDLYVVGACQTTDGLPLDIQHRFTHVRIPPLRDRVVCRDRGGNWEWDCDLFHIVAEVVRRHGEDHVAKGFLTRGLEHGWRGNVRELLAQLDDPGPYNDEGVAIGWPGATKGEIEGQAAFYDEHPMGRMTGHVYRGLFLHVDRIKAFAAEVLNDYRELYMQMVLGRGLGQSGVGVPEALNPVLVARDIEADPGRFVRRFPHLAGEVAKRVALRPAPQAQAPAGDSRAEKEGGLTLTVGLAGWDLRRARKAAEKELLVMAIAACEGRQKDVADKLNISPSHLSGLLREHGLR